MTFKRKSRLVLAATAALLLAAGAARALIWLDFTPVQLTEQADFILLLKLKPADAKGLVKTEVVRVLKGKDKAPKEAPVIDLEGAANVEHAKMVKKIIAAYGDGPALLFVGKGKEEEPASMIHFAGKWVSLDPTEKPNLWDMNAISTEWEALWAGGTDMLLGVTEMLVEYPDSDVPVQCGVAWAEAIKVGNVGGAVSEALAVDLDGGGKLKLFLASDAGDRIYACDAGSGKLGDLTAKLKLASRSKAATWADLNGDGRLDLASWDGAALSLFLQAADGTFAAGRKIDGAPAGRCLGLSALDAGTGNLPGLLWSGDAGPTLLSAEGSKLLAKARKLEFADADFKALGARGRCLVGDLDADGLADILQMAERASLFFRGTAPGSFAKAAKCVAALGTGRSGSYLGDWDMDGRLDVFCAAEDSPRLWHNRPGLKFEASIHICGELAYISKPGGFAGNVCDVNNDGRQDVFIVYTPGSNTGPQAFFNRGFRSFGHAHAIDINEKQLIGGVETAGQQAGVIADLTDDGAQDMVVVLKNGDTYFFPRVAEDVDPLVARVVLPLGGPVAGPVKVTAWNEKRCLGAWNVVAGTAEAFFGQIETGDIKIKWQLPGSKDVQEKTLTLEEKPIRFLLPAKAAAKAPAAPPPPKGPSASEGRRTGPPPPKCACSPTAMLIVGAVGGVVLLLIIVSTATRKKKKG